VKRVQEAERKKEIEAREEAREAERQRERAREKAARTVKYDIAQYKVSIPIQYLQMDALEYEKLFAIAQDCKTWRSWVATNGLDQA
jgi:hypothetical protein